MITLQVEAPHMQEAIDSLNLVAFRDRPFSRQTEHLIVRRLRDGGALSLSLVALNSHGSVIGHCAFSPVTLSGGAAGWYGMGPVSVAPDRQRQGIGSAMIAEGLARLRREGASGCVLLGDPRYYGRFGFASHAGLVLPGPPPNHFMALSFSGPVPLGTVRFHAAFESEPEEAS
jgi:predicted N-acetyltransferase YhbS